MKTQVLTRAQQRSQQERRQMLSIRLYFHLGYLLREIQAGDMSKLVEFQKMLQYAPAEMRLSLLDKLGGSK